MLKIAILTDINNGSPRVLAETLQPFIKDTGNHSKVFYNVKALRRLNTARKVRVNMLVWFLYKLKHLLSDKLMFAEISKMDTIIITACSPYGFYKDTYNIDKLKKKTGDIPVLYYAVQYLENSPTLIEKLKLDGHSLVERYDWHLTVSEITELRGKPAPPWSQIGMNLQSSGLKPKTKEEFFVCVDFLRPGYEQYRDIQIKVLEELNIKYISLEKEYSLQEIREIYKKSAVYFIQFPEAYGLPIAECLSCGSYIGTPDSSWPMAWRLDEKPEVHGPGKLPECFLNYKNEEDLKSQLQTIRDNYDLEETPKKVFDVFYKHYPTFYEGNMDSLKDVLKRIEEKRISSN